MDFSRASKKPRVDNSQITSRLNASKRKVTSLLDLSLVQVSRNLQTCNSLYKLPITLVSRLLKFFETDSFIQSSLTYLNLSGCEIKNDMLKSLHFLTKLEQLDICNCGDINGVALYYIGQIPNLKILKLNRSRKVNLGFNFLQNRLKTLEVSFCEIESPSLLHMTHLTCLENLNLMGNRLTDEGISFLQPLVNLIDLNISMNPSLTNTCLNSMQFPQLRHLNISFCEKVTVEGLRVLRSDIFKEFVGCDKISSGMISRPVVLLAEDDRVQQKIISRTLLRYNFDVDIADNGEIALEMYKKHSNKYSLILMDMLMPQMDGISCVKKIREEEEQNHWRRIPIILQTADQLDGKQSLFQEAGIDEVLQKPLDKECIALAITLLRK